VTGCAVVFGTLQSAEKESFTRISFFHLPGGPAAVALPTKLNLISRTSDEASEASS
jgi:hypothetical protein